MPIKVRFSKAGFYHPAFGRLGRGRNSNRVYVLPDVFAEKETIKVPIMDHSSRPPRKVDEKEITRFKLLPSDATIIDDDVVEELEEAAMMGDEDAAAEVDVIKKATMPKVATQEAFDDVVGRGKTAKAQSAQERTTGERSKSSSRKASSRARRAAKSE